jgi:hypothetical protein
VRPPRRFRTLARPAHERCWPSTAEPSVDWSGVVKTRHYGASIHSIQIKPDSKTSESRGTAV